MNLLKTIPYSSEIHSTHPCHWDCKLEREKPYHRWLMQWSSTQEFRVHRESFDSRVFIATDDSRVHHWLLGCSSSRRCIESLFDLGAPEIKVKHHQLIIPIARDKKGHVSQSMANTIESWKPHLDELGRLRSQWELTHPKPSSNSQSDRFQKRETYFYTFSMALIMATTVFMISEIFNLSKMDSHWMVYHHPWALYLLTTFLGSLATSFFTLLVWRQSSRMPKKVMEAATVGLLVFGGISPWIIYQLNRHYPATNSSYSYVSMTYPIQVKVKRGFREEWVFNEPSMTAPLSPISTSPQLQWKSIRLSPSLSEPLRQHPWACVTIQKGLFNLPLISKIQPLSSEHHHCRP